MPAGSGSEPAVRPAHGDIGVPDQPNIAKEREAPHSLSRKNPPPSTFVTVTEKTPLLEEVAEPSGDQLPWTRFVDRSTTKPGYTAGHDKSTLFDWLKIVNWGVAGRKVKGEPELRTDLPALVICTE